MLYPLKLSYATVTTLWGGRKLIDKWGKKTNEDKLSETWELTVRDGDKMSYIRNGESAGLSLKEYIEANGNSTVSSSYTGDRFPLLVKLIDASDKLSVQVHPDDRYAEAVEKSFGKTELWYIIDADPGAEIVYGLKKGIDIGEFTKAVRSNDYSKVLNRIKVKAGECYFIPSGMIHAIGSGILIAEIQQNSDITYRVYDYERRDQYGAMRELHIKKAIDVIHPFTENEIKDIRYANGGSEAPECLADSKYFKVLKVAICGERFFNADESSFHCIISVKGDFVIDYQNEKYNAECGECVYIPAGSGNYKIIGECELLISSINNNIKL